MHAFIGADLAIKLGITIGGLVTDDWNSNEHEIITPPPIDPNTNPPTNNSPYETKEERDVILKRI